MVEVHDVEVHGTVICACGSEISEERLEILPETKHCAKCAAKLPRVLVHDPNVVCARSSGSGRNGFAARD